MNKPLGLSGGIAKKFLSSEITPLLALVGLLLGFFAVLVTPREEEPQINVTFANVFIGFPGASSTEVEHLVSTPAEQILSEIEGIKHVYSVSQPGMSILTVQFAVGEDRTQAIVRLYNAIYSNQDWLPQGLGVSQPVIKPMGIDDVPIVTLTLWSSNPNTGGYELQQIAHTIEAELKRVPGTRDIYTIGGVDRVVHVQPDFARLSSYDVSFQDLKTALQLGNQSQSAGEMVSANNTIELRAGQFLASEEDVASLVVAVRNNAPIYLRDVAQISFGPDQPEQYVWFGTGPAAKDKSIAVRGESPAVTIAIAKKPGTNAVRIAKQVEERFEQLKGIFVPDDVQVTVTRNYGATADEKAKKLIGKLFFATVSVVILVFWTLGWKEAFIVGVAVVITLAITLFASWAWGFTINRVSLFALIFSIGILVDDAIVVVENIHRHLQSGEKSLLQAIPLAVDEVGGPTILATFAVIAALLPMAFVTGLMGPYMSPIPINASLGMLISLAVAFIVTPWMARIVLGGRNHSASTQASSQDSLLYGVFTRYMGPFLNGSKGSSKRWLMFAVIVVFIGISVLLPVFKAVVLKMLPFDNKSEFQIVLDMPERSSVEQTAAVLREIAAHVAKVPEVTDYQVYAGAASPINFNGLVRQYYLRSRSYHGDIQVNLRHKSKRDRSSHEVAASIRAAVATIAGQYKADVKVVEVPPGPPVMSPIVAEIYGLDYAQQQQLAKQIRAKFESTADITDVDDSVESAAAKVVVHVDRQKAAIMGVNQAAVVQEISMALGGSDVSFLHGDNVKYATPIRVEAAVGDKSNVEKLLALKIRNNQGHLISIADLVSVKQAYREQAIYHKDLLPVVFVSADLAGELDSPLYGMFDIVGQLDIEQYFINTPTNPYRFSLKWDGEWQVTYETFRDMGIAYAVGIVLIYLLVVAQFRSYFIPLIIMAPIPLTVIGVMPGHALLGSQFTATSMIGMIALAGIIVRNSILLVDFILEQHKQGMSLEEAVIRSGAVRAKPIVLTGLAAMLGAVFILDDPIFNGLAISLIFGVFVSTLLTLIVIPVMFYAYYYRYGFSKKEALE